jgi:hypothetical protein
MDQCLSIRDIQWLIFSDCTPRTLANLAVTCKLFRDTALDRLWRSVSFVNLVRAMPPDLWTHNGPAVGPAEFVRLVRAHSSSESFADSDAPAGITQANRNLRLDRVQQVRTSRVGSIPRQRAIIRTFCRIPEGAPAQAHTSQPVFAQVLWEIRGTRL